MKEGIRGFIDAALLIIVVFSLTMGVVSLASAQRIVQTDSLGNKQYHKQQYKIVDNKICPIDSVGNIEHHKGCAVMETAPPENFKQPSKQTLKDKR